MQASRKTNVKQLTLAALFIALTCVGTMTISIPIPGTHGFVNIGDTFVLLGGLLFSHFYGAAVGGFGSALADLFLGYSFYAPITLVVKGIEGFLAGKIAKPDGKYRVIAVVVSIIWMPIGYFLFETLIFGAPVALASLAANFIQGAVSGVLALMLYPVLKTILQRYI